MPLFGDRVTVTIYRNGNLTQTLTARKLMGILFQPLDPQLRGSDSNTDVWQARQVFADWPSGSNDEWPVLPNDRLEYNGVRYTIRGVRPYPHDHLELLVEATT